jgi:hypothetical protein
MNQALGHFPRPSPYMGRTKTDSEAVTDSSPIRSRKVRFLNSIARGGAKSKIAQIKGFVFLFQKQQDEK